MSTHKLNQGTNVFLIPCRDKSIPLLFYPAFVDRLEKKFPDCQQLEYAHCGLGVTGEAGELADAIKKHAIYGKPIDRTNVVEEIGDLLWYMQATMNKLEITFDEVLVYNYNKLKTRYEGLVYSDAAAINRADKKDGD